jgi:3-dehydroquinate synthetase
MVKLYIWDANNCENFFLEGLIEKINYIEMDQILNSLNLDTNFQKFKYAELRPYLMNDKKVSSGKLNLILLNSGLTGYKTDKFNPSNFSKAFKLN